MRFEINWPDTPGLNPHRIPVIRFLMQIKERDTGELTWVVFQRHISFMEPFDEGFAKMTIHQCVKEAFLHEADESIMIRGERVFDPHKDRFQSEAVARKMWP